MKTIFTLLLLSLLLFSCKKQKNEPKTVYTCSCRISVGALYKTSHFRLENMSYDEASKNCSSRNGRKEVEIEMGDGSTSGHSETWACQLFK